MPKITQLPTTTDIANDATLVVINDGLARRYAYQNLKNKLSAELTSNVVGIPTGGTSGQVLSKTSNTDYDVTWTTVSTGGSSSSTGLGTRTSASQATASIANNGTGNIEITGFKSYALLKVQTSEAAWVRLYTTNDARSNDSSRDQFTDPAAGVGVIADVITTAYQTQSITPGIFGFNDNDPVDTTIYAAVTNLSGAPATITVTLTLLQLEA